MITITIQQEPFDVTSVIQVLVDGDDGIGALCTFSGYVRGHQWRAEQGVAEMIAMELEHYPGMTEKAIRTICDKACQRWPVKGIHVTHRVGRLVLSEPIVLVAVTTAHRQASFEACHFVMDFLKVDAPFWKKEIYRYVDNHEQITRWVEQRSTDVERQQQW